MSAKVEGILKVRLSNGNLVEVQDLKVKYEPGIVDNSGNYAVSINGEDVMISERDLEILENDLKAK